MIIVDKTGRKLKPGESIVDVSVAGMVQGLIINVIDQPIAIPGNPPIVPHIVVAVTLTPRIQPNGMVHGVYIIGEHDPKKEDENLRKMLSGGLSS